MKLKQKFNGDNYYYLGKGKEDGVYYFLQEASFDCDWYWGVNYLEGFDTPNLSKAYDIVSHEHFMSSFSSKEESWYDWLLKKVDSPLNEKDLWLIMEIAASLKILTKYMELSYRGGSNYTDSKKVKAILEDKDAYDDVDAKIQKLNELLDRIYEDAQNYVNK